MPCGAVRCLDRAQLRRVGAALIRLVLYVPAPRIEKALRLGRGCISFREPKTPQRRSTVSAATESPPAALKGTNGCALRRRAVRRAYDQRSRCQPTVLIGTVTCEANQQRTISEHAGCRANRPQHNRISPTDRSNGIHWLRRSAECCSRAQRRRMCGSAAWHGCAGMVRSVATGRSGALRSDIIGSDKT
jgi:hypothetical protein